MRPTIPNGFILLEVLIAMSLILGSWMVSVRVYQGLALRFTQEEGKRKVLRLSFDVYETKGGHLSLVEHSSSGKHIHKGINNESSRMSSRNRAVHNSAHSVTPIRR